MSIVYSQEFRSFYLTTPNTSYVFHINEGGFLIHDYYGKRLPLCDMRDYSVRLVRGPKSADGTTSPGGAPMEYACSGTGDFRVSALRIRNAAGDSATDIRYVSHKIYGGKPAIPHQPSTYGTEEEVSTLEILTEDAVTGAKVTLYYSVFDIYDAITRRAVIENGSDYEMDLERVYSLCCEIPFGNWQICHLYGEWSRERTFERSPLIHGVTSVESSRGCSSHQHNPFVALVDEHTTEDMGHAYGFNLVYSGNFSAQTEQSVDGHQPR